MHTNLLALTQNHGCTFCSHEENTEKQRLSTDEIINIVNRYNGVLLNPNDYTGWNDKNLRIVCSNCGRPFITSLNSFAKHCGQLCLECSKVETKGEHKVRLFLETYCINYYPQFRFDNCRYKNSLPFDFYLPDLKTVIEYDGEFHYQVIILGNETKEQAEERFKIAKLRDEIKNEYCKNNDIDIIRIPYWDYNDINYILYNKIID